MKECYAAKQSHDPSFMDVRSFLRSTALLCLFSVTFLQAQGSFRDTVQHFSQPFAEILHSSCGIEGYRDAAGQPLGLFRPDSSITRAELITMIIQCHPRPHVESGEAVFSDVAADSWYASAVSRAAVSGWVQGYSDGTFRPSASVNRAEALKMLVNASGATEVQTFAPITFRDVHGTDWFYPYVMTAASRGYIQGRSVGVFAPEGLLTRGEAAKLLVYFFGLYTPEAAATTPEPVPSPATAAGTFFAGCPIFPADNPWNQDIRSASAHPNSDQYIASILAGRKTLHPDFGSNPDYGIPFVVVDKSTPKSPIIAEYADETDAGPYPIPSNPPIEAGSDRHILMLHKDECVLYELYAAVQEGAQWFVGSGAIFDLTSNALRPDYWTSADAAGLPIFPGLVRYDEVESGTITHALRFTVSKTQRAFIHPATHFASSSTDANRPPMGLRLRLKADYDISHVTGHSRVILEALKTYGMILADNGSDWFISGATDPRWDDEDLSQIKKIPGSAFEAVYTGDLVQ